MITVYSFCCSVVFFNVSLIGVFLLRRKTWFLAKYAASSLILLTILGLIHLAIPVDLEAAYAIRSAHVIPAIQRAAAYKLFNGNVSAGMVLLFVWGTGTMAFCIRDIAILLKARRSRASYVYVEDEQVNRIAAEFGGSYTVKVSPDIRFPHMAGLFHPVIYLPCLDLTDDELRFILQHEIQHILSCDILKKFLFLAIEALFWWNPIAHISMREIDALLELQCDAKVTADLDEKGKVEYMQAILSAAKQTCRVKKPDKLCVLSFAKDPPHLKQRFDVLLCQNRCNSKWARTLLNFVFLAVFVLSYMVIVQPAYTPPVDDLSDVYILTQETSFVLSEEGHYKLYYNDSCIGEISEDELNSLPYSKLELIER